MRTFHGGGPFGHLRQRALLNMAFNLGWNPQAPGGLDDFKNTLRAMQDGHWTLAAAGMRASLWARQVGARAERLARMIETGQCDS
jgi:lysozyme